MINKTHTSKSRRYFDGNLSHVCFSLWTDPWPNPLMIAKRELKFLHSWQCSATLSDRSRTHTGIWISSNRFETHCRPIDKNDLRGIIKQQLKTIQKADYKQDTDLQSEWNASLFLSFYLGLSHYISVWWPKTFQNLKATINYKKNIKFMWWFVNQCLTNQIKFQSSFISINKIFQLSEIKHIEFVWQSSGKIILNYLWLQTN